MAIIGNREIIDNNQGKDTSSIFPLAVASITLLWIHGAFGWASNDPTYGFVPVPLNDSNFDIQKPYNLPVSERYSFVDGVHRLWVLSTDKPMSNTTNNTSPRTEIRIRGYDYSSGVWQFHGYGYVPNGTPGVCIMQLFGAIGHATTVMMRVYNGSLTYYRYQVVVPNIYDRWFRLNVIHDVGAKRVSIFIDGVLKLEVDDRGGASHYFKCGVYAQGNRSHYMESRWKDIKVLKKM
ncbi:citrate-binding protein-like [Magnolia sinica]|uniref:citrate-binding protein-like n=1 Tax=Magnolia sinica TaxID=86752 RepID=UPI0026594BA1|nr:citrate-binding protein-like [Magnolia sinica]